MIVVVFVLSFILNVSEACSVDEDIVVYENEPLILMFAVDTSNTEFASYSIDRKVEEEKDVNYVKFYLHNGQSQDIFSNGAEPIGNISTGNISFRIPSANISHRGLYILSNIVAPPIQVECIQVIYRACSVDEDIVVYENEPLILMFAVDTSNTEFASYSIDRKVEEEKDVNYVKFYLHNGQSQDIFSNGAEPIGNISTGNISFRIPSANISHRGLYILSNIVAPPIQVECIQVIYRARPSSLHFDNTGSEGNITSTEDRNVSIVCSSFGGYPKPYMTLFRTDNNTSPLEENNNTGQADDRTYFISYTFQPKREDDRALFICQLSYDPPEPFFERIDTYLMLRLKPSDPELMVQEYLVESETDQNISNCKSDGFRPGSANMTIQLDGENVVSSKNSTLDSSSGMYSIAAVYKNAVMRRYNGKNIQCIINHTSLDQAKITTKSLSILFKPENISLQGNTSGIEADKGNNISLNCTTGSSNPLSNISWFINRLPFPNNAVIQKHVGDYNGTVVSQTLDITADRSMDGDSIYCTTTNNVSLNLMVKSEEKKLDLVYHPTAEIINGGEVIEGQKKTFLCRVESKPIANISWYHNNSTLSDGKNVPGNKANYTINSVNRIQAGWYQCRAENGYNPRGENKTYMLVKYAPDVEVTATNVTVKNVSAVLYCKAFGVPDRYTFSEWQHIWPGYGIITHTRSLGNNPNLTLTNLTYEYSGIYKCSVSNGIEGSLKPNAGYGDATLKVTTYPIITTTGKLKIPARLNSNTTFTIEYYSNIEVNDIYCRRDNTTFNCSTSHSDGEVYLSVFGSVVRTAGHHANITLIITDMEHFGNFTIWIENSIGGDEKIVELVPEGPPEVPKMLEIESVTSQTATISWIPGFHGGFYQTFFIHYKKEFEGWQSAKTKNVTGKQLAERLNTTIRDLGEGTLYFIRMNAGNIQGNSNFTKEVNVTTRFVVSQAKVPGSSLPYIAGGVGGGILCIALLVIVIIFIRRRKNKDGDKNQIRRSLYKDGSIYDEDGMEANQAYVTADSLRVQQQGTSGDEYAQVDKTSINGRTDDDKTYAVVNKTNKADDTDKGQAAVYAVPLKKKTADKKRGKEKKKDKRDKKKSKSKGNDVYENAQELNVYNNIGLLNDGSDENVYEKRQEPDTPKRNLNKDGLLYADIAFNNNNRGPKKLVIHGIENATEYVQVDFTKKADPLPDSDNEGDIA